MLNDAGVNPVCCGEDMQLLVANTEDSGAEKHVPVIEQDKGHVKVSVGAQPHPMLTDHHIEWIILLTDQGFYVRYLKPLDEPVACFNICDSEKVLEAYEYCNIHGLWKA